VRTQFVCTGLEQSLWSSAHHYSVCDYRVLRSSGKCLGIVTPNDRHHGWHTPHLVLSCARRTAQASVRSLSIGSIGPIASIISSLQDGTLLISYQNSIYKRIINCQVCGSRVRASSSTAVSLLYCSARSTISIWPRIDNTSQIHHDLAKPCKPGVRHPTSASKPCSARPCASLPLLDCRG
jgi:hypothetical protein